MHVIINGNDSRQLTGVQVLEISPIHKPAMRRTIEYIDGRDGDIVTKLGYEAYDRYIVIGLHDCFDIDKISQFFESSGTITFSDEETKYYTFQMIDGIDYEKLNEFRKAKITFHLQPFKYSTVDGMVEFSGIPPVVGTGEWSSTVKGITASTFDSVIDVDGTSTALAIIDVPISGFFPKGYYQMAYNTGGGTVGGTTVQLLSSSRFPLSNATALILNATATSTMIHLTEDRDVGYLRITVPAGRSPSLSFTVDVIRYFQELPLFNFGNTPSQPVITIYGEGEIIIYINDKKVLDIDMPEDGVIAVDAEHKEATSGGVLSNRSVSGDYDALYLNPGYNTLSFEAGIGGKVESVNFERYSRWI